MAHKPQSVLKAEIDTFSSGINVGGMYTHHKDPNKVYKVLTLGIMEADDSVCVIYQAQYDKRIVFVRPVQNWLDTVHTSNGPRPRFSKVEQ